MRAEAGGVVEPAAPNVTPGPVAAAAAPASTAKIWAALVVVYVLWGSTYLAIRVAVRTTPAFLGAGARFVVAAGLLAAFLRWRGGRGALRISRRELAGATVVGLLLPAAGNGLVVLAEQHIDSGLAALLVAAVPLWVVLWRAATRDRPRPATLAGVVLGFVGLAILVHPGGHGRLLATLTVLVASFSWATGSFLSGRLTLPRNALVTTTYEMLTGGFALLVASVARGEPWRFHPAQVQTSSWVALAYLVVFGSLAAYTAYGWLLQSAPISLVATYAYVNPVVAVLLGALLLSEPVTASVVGGGLLVVVAVGLVVSTERRPRA